MHPVLLVTLYCAHMHASTASAAAIVAPSSAFSGAVAVVPSAKALDYAVASGARWLEDPEMHLVADRTSDREDRAALLKYGSLIRYMLQGC